MRNYGTAKISINDEELGRIDDSAFKSVDVLAQQDRELQMLDLINRVQMFQIASSKVNQNLLQRKKNPVFNLQFTEQIENNTLSQSQVQDLKDFADEVDAELNDSVAAS